MARGFTLIELVMVIVLLGVLAVFAAPRILTSDFYARGFHDESLALLRYAQKTAVAQRRTVCVAFTSTTVSLTVVATASDTTCPGGTLAGPRGNASVTAGTGVSYSATPSDFYFNGLGQASAGQVIQVTLNGTAIGRQITVESTTGYVHE